MKKPDFARSALRIVQYYFPRVTRVNDAEKPTLIEVTRADNDWANDKDHKTCSFAVACKRMLHADGIIVGMTRTYVIKGNIATRYSNPDTLSREITSFDRKAGFDTGLYTLVPPCPSMRFGVARTRGTSSKSKSGKGPKTYRHFTRGVRTVLGSHK